MKQDETKEGMEGWRVLTGYEQKTPMMKTPIVHKELKELTMNN